jgi:uncharacterized membrane protein
MIAIYPISDGYQIVAILHILAVIVAFGPLFLYPSLRRAGETQTIAKLHMRMSFPALVLVWVLGMGMTGMSDDTFKVSPPWIVLAILAWLALVGVSWLLIRPALTDTSEAATARLAAGTGVTHLLLVVTLYLMVFKPGW